MVGCIHADMFRFRHSLFDDNRVAARLALPRAAGRLIARRRPAGFGAISRRRVRTCLCRTVASVLLLAVASVQSEAQAPRRVLHVSMYPFIPDAAAAALALTRGVERGHPGIVVEITLNPNSYSRTRPPEAPLRLLRK